MKKRIILLMALMSMICGTLRAQSTYSLEEILPQINADSLLRTVLDLQNFGSRLAIREGGNREVAEYLVQRFENYGVTAVIDSFFLQGVLGHQIIYQWFYNVKGVLPADNPIDDSLILVGAHLDAIAFSYNNAKELVDAPGADDNASGVAVMIELARICHENNLQFRRDIHFMAFDFEEFGKFGSQYDAQKRKDKGEKIALMMNNDMVSYQPDDNWILFLRWYYNAMDVVSRAAAICSQYTKLVPVIASYSENEERNMRSDSYSYYKNGFRAIYSSEYTMSQSYHSSHDVADSNNYDYLAEVTRYNMAMLAAYADPASGITSKVAAARAYPNPTCGKVTIQYILDNISPVHIAVFDMQGREVIRHEITLQNTGLHHLELDFSGLRSGVYVIQFRTHKGVETLKVVRQ